MNYATYEFTGYVYKKRDSKYGMELFVRSEYDESEVKYPQHMMFKVSTKNTSRVDPSLGINDKIKVTFLPTLAEGVSEKTNRAYAINQLNLQDCEILERAPEPPQEESQPEDEDIPF